MPNCKVYNHMLSAYLYVRLNNVPGTMLTSKNGTRVWPDSSHTCGDRRCSALGHVFLESKAMNDSRKFCCKTLACSHCADHERGMVPVLRLIKEFTLRSE